MAFALLRSLGVWYFGDGMRQFGALAALLLSGCVYTDPVNQRPVIDQMQVAPPPTRFDKDVVVTYDVYDPDGDDFDVHADVMEVSAFMAGRYQLRFRPTGPGSYHVKVSATDSLGADSGERQIIVEVPNMAPQVGPPPFTADEAPTSGQYPLGTTFTVQPPTIDDDDHDPQPSVTYETISPSGQRAEIAAMGSFTAITDGPYEIDVTVTDPNGPSSTARTMVSVAADRAPCILGTAPDASTPHLPAFVGQTKRLAVTRVDDDLNPWPPTTHGAAQFQWLIKNPGDTDFRVVAGATQAFFDIDGSLHTVGDEVLVRVIVTDPAHAAPSCPPEQPRCDYVGGCPGRLTWDLEYFAP